MFSTGLWSCFFGCSNSKLMMILSKICCVISQTGSDVDVYCLAESLKSVSKNLFQALYLTFSRVSNPPACMEADSDLKFVLYWVEGRFRKL